MYSSLQRYKKDSFSLNKQKSIPAIQYKDNRAVNSYHTQLQDLIGQSPKSVAQRAQLDTITAHVQKKKNKTGLPDRLKNGIENLSGMDMSDTRVYYNSSKPAQLQAHAYAQGNQIHLAPGQEKHLPHEAWHIVQQKQGRVNPTIKENGVAINDNVHLEKEADVMGIKAVQKYGKQHSTKHSNLQRVTPGGTTVFQNQRNISHRKNLKRKAKKAIKLITSGGLPGGPASRAEVLAHDQAMSPGQHHEFRHVLRSRLIADLRQRVLDHATNNIRDSKVLNDPANARNAGLVLQMAKKPIK
ncbi:DUF4157 domain-containing protein [Aquimarina sp. RZ0]|uniref:eCIS core domain-containing protein n=1 Tax=Aquimarina sp. RZ0 TaxID=2607730 RepID=UPI0011F1ED8A|nr:DUF4157 domain-containing protein [Aquimarina sp. RZ0]KAA1246582.1 DUF4157 domain-containing protein [Aquimarina sp. RZ0]